MNKILAMALVAGAAQAFAAPVASEPFVSTTAVTSEVQAQTAVSSESTFWSSATTWNAGIIDVLRRVWTGLSVIVK